MKVGMTLAMAVAAMTASAMEIECGKESPEAYAAKELKKFVSLLAEEEPEAKFRIGTKWLDEFPDDRKTLNGWDGYAVRRKDGWIYIVSPQPRGCLYGVYDFLERNSDIIWARPDEECGTIYTRTKAFVIKAADFVERPKFQMRGWWFCGPQRHAASEYWHARVRCNFGCCNQKYQDVLKRAVELGSFVGGAAGHNLPQFIPDFEYEKHPEYFALVSGTRRRDKEKTQFCFSNMEGAETVGAVAARKIAEKLADYRAKGTTFDHWALKQADNQRMCECEKCAADIVLPDGRVVRKGDENFLSTRTFIYLNRAMEIIEREHPEMRVDTFAYQFTAPAPAVTVHPKFNVAFCPFIKNDRFPVCSDVNAIWRRRSEAWAKATTNIMWREYWGCASGYPRQHSLVAAKDLKWINGSLGFTRVYSETVPDLDNRGKKGKGVDFRTRWDASAMEHWVLSRLMWNPDVPVEKYREEYVMRTYRKAASPMREFYALLAKTWFSDGAMSNYCDDPHGNAARYIVRPGIDKKLLALLDEAERLVADDMPTVRKLLARQKAHFKDLIENCGTLEEPTVVAKVTDGDWSKAAVFDGFSKVSRSKKAALVPTRRHTKVLLMHDGKNLLVKFICDDPDPSKLEGKAPDPSEKEGFPGGDHVEFAITTEKGLHAYQFGLGCKGRRGDLRDGSGAWNASWKTDVKVTATGYEATLVIDFESLKIELTKGNRFGVAFARMATPRNGEKKRDFSSWKGVHPQASSAFAEVFLNQE